VSVGTYAVSLLLTISIISANIRTMDAAYDGLKSTLNVMENITNGLPWPLKSAPQTFLYILSLFEVRTVVVTHPTATGTVLQEHTGVSRHPAQDIVTSIQPARLVDQP